MKIAYIGSTDKLAETIVERMIQEGDDVYLVSKKPLSKKGSLSRHRFYRTPRNSENFQHLLQSISPDCILFAGNYFFDNGPLPQGADEDITLLAQTLRVAATFSRVKVILLSSIEVYGNTGQKVNESAPCAPVSESGIHFVRKEQLLTLYRQLPNVESTILRVSQLYSDHPSENGKDFLSKSFNAVMLREGWMQGGVFQPLNVSDLADAVKRVIDNPCRPVFNVCGDNELTAEQLHALICQYENKESCVVKWENPAYITLASNELIKRELGWRDFHNLPQQLANGEIHFSKAPKKKRAKKKGIIPKPVRQFIENLLIFAFFFAIDYFTGSNSLLSQVNWMMIYVILISVSYSIYQSAFAAVLASAAYLFGQHLGVFDFNSFDVYAGSVLAIMEFVFLGLLVSYTTNMLRERNKSLSLDLDILKDEYSDIKAINDENVLIKNEYETRLLTSKTGFPKLYSMISRLMVQEPDRILMETMQIIAELVQTNTVAVYQGQAGSPWLRLVGSLNEESTMGAGKTWNISESPHIYDAVMLGELYQGEFGSDEPAVVLPVICGDVTAIIVIKILPYESENLYHINLLKTMSLLLRDSMEKALQYEDMSREKHYYSKTDILKPSAFSKRLALAQEKAEKDIAEYCLIELSYSGSIIDAAKIASELLRVTDCLGTNGEGRLFALLNNTGVDSLDNLKQRLAQNDITVCSIFDGRDPSVNENLYQDIGLAAACFAEGEDDGDIEALHNVVVDQ